MTHFDNLLFTIVMTMRLPAIQVTSKVTSLSLLNFGGLVLPNSSDIILKNVPPANKTS